MHVQVARRGQLAVAILTGSAKATYGKWSEVFKTLGSAPRDIAEAKRKVLLQEAQFLRTKILEGLREQAPGGEKFKELSPQTIAIRKFMGFKGTKALMKRGDLRNAVAVVDMGDTIFIGVPRTAKGAGGQNLVDVAELNEYGGKPHVIKMTPKMSALLHAAFREAGLPKKDPHAPVTGIVVVQVPARPFIRPVMEQYGRATDVEKRMADRLQKLMKGKGAWSAVNKVGL